MANPLENPAIQQLLAVQINALIGGAIDRLFHHAQQVQAPAAPPAPPVLAQSPALPTPTPARHAPVSSVPVLVAAPVKVFPTSLGINADLMLVGNVLCPATFEDHGDYYEAIKADGTSNLPIHGGAQLHAIYYDDQGAINWTETNSPDFRANTNLFNTARWIARCISGPKAGQTDKIETINGVVTRTDKNVANFQAAEYARTGGMDVPVHFPPEMNECVVEIGLEVDGPNGVITTPPIRFPKIS
jgi:hypothetical protein